MILPQIIKRDMSQKELSEKLQRGRERENSAEQTGRSENGSAESFISTKSEINASLF